MIFFKGELSNRMGRTEQLLERMVSSNNSWGGL